MAATGQRGSWKAQCPWNCGPRQGVWPHGGSPELWAEKEGRMPTWRQMWEVGVLWQHSVEIGSSLQAWCSQFMQIYWSMYLPTYLYVCVCLGVGWSCVRWVQELCSSGLSGDTEPIGAISILISVSLQIQIDERGCVRGIGSHDLGGWGVPPQSICKLETLGCG